jgi:hypothetical protein
VKHVRGNINGLASDLVGPAAVVTNAADDTANISTGHCDRLAIVHRLDSGEEVQVLLDEIGKFEEERGAGARRGSAPCCVEGLASSSDSKVNVFLGSLADGGDDFFGGRVDDFELLLVDTLDPFVVDEPVQSVCKWCACGPKQPIGEVGDEVHLQANGLRVLASNWRVKLGCESHGETYYVS